MSLSLTVAGPVLRVEQNMFELSWTAQNRSWVFCREIARVEGVHVPAEEQIS